jgi:hypothetical protein
MKKIRVIEAVKLNKILDRVMLVGAPTEDSKAVLKLCGEIEPIAIAWDKAVKTAMQKLDLKEGDAMTLAEVNKYLSEVLQDEMMREVEITPFALSAEGEATILSQSRITRGEIRAIRELVKPAEEE